MHSTARLVRGLQCRQLLQVQRQLLHKWKSHTIYCNEHNCNWLQSIEPHQAMQRSRLTRTTILPLNAYDWWGPNEKSPDNDIWVNTVVLHDQSAPTEERLSTNEIRLQRSTTRWEFTYGGEAMEAHLQWKSVYCDRILDVCVPFRRIPTAMTAYATKRKMLSINWHHRSRSRSSKYHFCEFNHQYLRCYKRWWSTCIPTYLPRPQLCWARWLSEALQMLHPTPSGDSELLPVMYNYQATRKRANSQLILRYYVDRQLFSLWRWQPGVPMTSAGGPQIPRLLDLEAIYTTYYGVRQCYRPPVHGWGRCMQSTFWALMVPAWN